MNYNDLETYASRMIELNGDGHGLRPHRLEAERGKVHMAIMQILRASMNRMATRKKLNPRLRDELEQHTSIGVIKALGTWQPELGKFSTYVHWQIMAELQTLQWTEYPERRRLVLAQPLKIMEIDRPTQGEMGEDHKTFADTMSDEGAEARVEEKADQYIAYRKFERVMSHYIMKKLQSFDGDKKDKKSVESKQTMVMRNYHIYVQRVILLHDSEKVSLSEGMTRERIRQIIKKIDDELKGQLPKICPKDRHTIIAANRPAPVDIHPEWEATLLQFLADTGKDARVLNRPPEAEASKGAIHETVVISNEGTRIANIEEVEEDVAATLPTRTDNVIQFVAPQRRNRLAEAIVTAAAIAGGGMMMASAASSQSRALPPASIEPANPEEEQARQVLPDRSPGGAPAYKRHARSMVSPRASQSALMDVSTVRVEHPSWAAALERYDTLGALKIGEAKTKPWQWTAGLRHGYVHQDQGYRVAYGPVTRQQAEGLCHEAKRVQRDCGVISYGTPSSTGAST